MIQRPTRDSSGVPTAVRWALGLRDDRATSALAEELACSRLLATLLWQRGLRDPASAQRFLHPQLSGLHPPETMPDVARGVAAVRRALRDRKRICIYGDYDVDGLTATALLVELFRHLGHEVGAYVPDRLREGYGLNGAALRQLAAEGTGLLITVDAGSNQKDEIELARRLGMEVVVTDHHPIHGELPAVPVIHPGRDGSAFAGLAGVGVVYKFIWALGKDLAGSQKVTPEYREFMLSALGFVALGTVADVVPLREENRILVRYGLRALGHTKRPGLRALLQRCRVRPDAVTAEDVGFRLAPHLNAAGRLGRAEEALAILLTDDEAEGDRLARSLAEANRERKDIERRMIAECEAQLAGRGDLDAGGAMVLSNDGWHSGVAGIVAARLVDRYQRPAFVIALDEGLGRGSIRSLPDYPLAPIYEALRDVTLSIGGHDCAGGLTLAADRVGDFRHAITTAYQGVGWERGVSLPVDVSLRPESIDATLVGEIARLGPFGHDNPVPRFLLDNLDLAGSPRLVGQREEHLRFAVRAGDRTLRAVYFRGSHRASALSRARGQRLSLVAELRHTPEWGVEVRVVDMRIGEEGAGTRTHGRSGEFPPK